MIRTFVLLSVSCTLTWASVAPVVPSAQNQLLPAPVVTSASSQYFERIFNRLVFAPPVLEAPVIPFAPAAVPAVATLPAQTTPTAAPENNPNVAIAIASAQAAPVATILLPPYPFGPPSAINFIPSVNLIPTDRPQRETEPTTERMRTTTHTTTTQPQQPSAAPSNNNNFLQGLPYDENVKFNQYYAPKPEKVKTTVEVVPVPLAYIAPPPLKLLRVKNHFVPTKERIILRPVTSHNSVIRIKVPVRIVRYKPYYKLSHPSRKSGLRSLPFPASGSRRYAEPTTLRPFNSPNGPSTKPPRA